MRRMRGCGLVALVVGLALAACMPPRTPGTGGDAPATLAGTVWRLTELNGRAPIPGGETLTLMFDPAGSRASGNGGCNQFNGPYTQAGASLRLGPLVSTRRACANAAANAQETSYLRALESTTRSGREGGSLVLYDGTRAVARFQPTSM